MIFSRCLKPIQAQAMVSFLRPVAQLPSGRSLQRWIGKSTEAICQTLGNSRFSRHQLNQLRSIKVFWKSETVYQEKMNFETQFSKKMHFLNFSFGCFSHVENRFFFFFSGWFAKDLSVYSFGTLAAYAQAAAEDARFQADLLLQIDVHEEIDGNWPLNLAIDITIFIDII